MVLQEPSRLVATTTILCHYDLFCSLLHSTCTRSAGCSLNGCCPCAQREMIFCRHFKQSFYLTMQQLLFTLSFLLVVVLSDQITKSAEVDSENLCQLFSCVCGGTHRQCLVMPIQCSPFYSNFSQDSESFDPHNHYYLFCFYYIFIHKIIMPILTVAIYFRK